MKTEQSSDAQKRKLYFRVATFLLLFAVPLLYCGEVNDLNRLYYGAEAMDATGTSEQKTREANSDYQTEVAKEATEFWDFYTQRALGFPSVVAANATEQARLDLTATSEALGKALTETSEVLEAASHTPVIVYVDFPTKIPGDHENIAGTIQVTDAAKDINWVQFDVVEATGNFSPGGFTPDDTDWTGSTAIVHFTTWCEGRQLVRQRVTVRDAAGNTSDPVTITFTCQ